jgi:hypothetical protein
MREKEDLSNRNATLEKENMLSNSLIRSLRDEENRQLKFIDNLQYQIKLLKSDVNVDNQHLEKLVKELKLKDGEICRLTQQTNKLNDELKWANMLGSPSIHIFNLEPETTSDFLKKKKKNPSMGQLQEYIYCKILPPEKHFVSVGVYPIPYYQGEELQPARTIVQVSLNIIKN